MFSFSLYVGMMMETFVNIDFVDVSSNLHCQSSIFLKDAGVQGMDRRKFNY